jgi:hypothetical protein
MLDLKKIDQKIRYLLNRGFGQIDVRFLTPTTEMSPVRLIEPQGGLSLGSGSILGH